MTPTRYGSAAETSATWRSSTSIPAARASAAKPSSARQRHVVLWATCFPNSGATTSHDRRAGVCAAQGGVRRSSCSGTGACEEPALSLTGGVVPPDVRHPGADGQSTDASGAATATVTSPFTPTSLEPAASSGAMAQLRPLRETHGESDAHTPSWRHSPNSGRRVTGRFAPVFCCHPTNPNPRSFARGSVANPRLIRSLHLAILADARAYRPIAACDFFFRIFSPSSYLISTHMGGMADS